MFNTAVTKKKHGRAAPKMRHHASSKSSISNHSSSSSSSSDEELVIRRKNLPSVKGEADSTSARHRRPSSRSSVEKGHSRRLCHPHPSPHHYHAQQTYSLDRSHPHVGHASGWCPPPTWSASPSSWLYPPADIYPAMQQQRASCCCCHTPTVSCQVYTHERKQDYPSINPHFPRLIHEIEFVICAVRLALVLLLPFLRCLAKAKFVCAHANSYFFKIIIIIILFFKGIFLFYIHHRMLANHVQFSRFLFCLKPETDERVQRLEGDKDSLQMQVSILMDQIEAQTEKIADLERTLSDRAFQLQKSEDNFQKVECVTLTY